MKAIVSLDEFRKNLSDIVGNVMYGNQTVVVQKHNRTGVVVISEREYESLKDPRNRFTSQEDWDKGFVLMDKIRANTAKYPPKEVQKVIEETVREIRQSKRV